MFDLLGLAFIDVPWFGELLDAPPLSVDQYPECSPIYEELPGWSESTAGITSYDDLPQNARNYLDRMQDVLNVPIDLISTGPDRDHTIILTPPYD